MKEREVKAGKRNAKWIIRLKWTTSSVREVIVMSMTQEK